MRQHVGGDVGDVVGEHVVAVAQQGGGPGGGDQAEGGAGTDAVLDQVAEPVEPELFRRAGRDHEVDGVLRHRVVHEEPARRLLQREHLLGVEHGAGARRLDAHPLEDGELLVVVGVGHVDLHEEPVSLGLGELVDALGLHGVLGREDQERSGSW